MSGGDPRVIPSVARDLGGRAARSARHPRPQVPRSASKNTPLIRPSGTFSPRGGEKANKGGWPSPRGSGERVAPTAPLRTSSGRVRGRVIEIRTGSTLASTRISAALLLLLLLLALPLAAETAQVHFRQVQIPVSVLDNAGNPLRNLRVSDFDVLEDGTRVDRVELAVVDYGKVPAAALSPIPAAARRQFLLLFDLGVAAESLERAQHTARRFVKDVILPRDLVAVGSVDRERGFRLLCAFTTDRELVSSALDDPRAFRGSDPLQIANQTVIWNAPALAAEAKGAAVASEPVRHPLIEQIGMLANAVRRIVGRKQIVLFTEDFDKASAPAEMIEKAARSCRSAGVVLHAVNAGAKGGGGLVALTAPTSGEVIRTPADINTVFESVLHRQEVVYVLSYWRDITAPAKFHELSVRVPSVSRAVVLHPSGYSESGNESGFERVMANAEAIVNDVASDDIHVAVLGAGFPTAGVYAQVPVVVDIDGNDVLKQLEGGAAAVHVFIYAFDASGVVRDRVYQRMSVDAAKTEATLRSGGVKYLATLSLSPGKYAVRTLVTVGDAKGFARTDVEVRGAKQTALLPPLFIDDVARWVLVKGAMHAGTAPYPFHINGEPFVPSARALVRNGRAQKVALFVLNSVPGDLDWQMSVVDAAGRAHSAAPAASAVQGEGVSKLIFDYTPADLPAGSATASFIIQKRSSSESQRTSAAMVIVP